MTQTLTTENQTHPTEKKYRVIQWGMGNVGTLALRHFAHNPTFEVVGVLCNRPEKVGKDAGELVGVAPIGVPATTDKDALEALDADCVFYAPLWSDVDEICRLLRGGKSVVASGGAWWHRTETNSADIDKIEAACQEGGTSFHGGGIHPGYAADLLVLTLARIVGKTDHIHIYEVGQLQQRHVEVPGRDGLRKDSGRVRQGQSLPRRLVVVRTVSDDGGRGTGQDRRKVHH